MLPDWLQMLRRTFIVRPVMDHPRSTSDLRMGFDSSEVYNRIIRGGQAEFDQAYGKLDPSDRALLYAFFLQKRHLEELVGAFRLLFPNGLPDNLTMLDIGCGPATAGLALAGAVGTTKPFRYYGIDRAASMVQLADELLVEAKRLAAFHPRAVATLSDSLSGVGPARPSWNPLLVVTSYLHASPSLDGPRLIIELDGAFERFGRGPVTFLYTNAERESANVNWPSFQAELRTRGFVEHEAGLGQIAGRSLRYSLLHRPPRSTLDL